MTPIASPADPTSPAEPAQLQPHAPAKAQVTAQAALLHSETSSRLAVALLLGIPALVWAASAVSALFAG